MAPGLSEMLIRPIFEAAGMPSETAAYATGIGDHGFASELLGMAVCWLFFYGGILGSWPRPTPPIANGRTLCGMCTA